MAVVLRLLHAIMSGDFVGVVVMQEDPDAKEGFRPLSAMAKYMFGRSTLRVNLSIWGHHWDLYIGYW